MGTDPTPRFAALIRQLLVIRGDLDALEDLAVQLVRDTGVTWEAIGDELGISRQAARQRFSHRKPRRQPRQPSG